MECTKSTVSTTSSARSTVACRQTPRRATDRPRTWLLVSSKVAQKVVRTDKRLQDVREGGRCVGVTGNWAPTRHSNAASDFEVGPRCSQGAPSIPTAASPSACVLPVDISPDTPWNHHEESTTARSQSLAEGSIARVSRVPCDPGLESAHLPPPRSRRR